MTARDAPSVEPAVDGVNARLALVVAIFSIAAAAVFFKVEEGIGMDSACKPGIYETVESMREMLVQMSRYIHDHPELGHQEFKAHKLLTDVLEQHGFQVDRELLGMPTAFRAVYSSGGGPVLGLLCEYDALPELGHGCAHNLQGPAMVGAALALRRVLAAYPATIIVYGTPAEESQSGKIPMTQAGLFDGLDIALMMHGSDTTTVDGKSLAVNVVDFIFEGKAAHAAIAPEKGVSALDAVLMTFNGIEYLREHVRADVRLHGVITDGGKAANIVPERAAAQFYIRAGDRPYLDTVVERVYNVARAGALATGAKLSIREVKAYDNKFNVTSLNKILLDNAAAAGAAGISPPREKTGSTDFSCVTYRVPGACLRVQFVPPGTASHSRAWEKAAAEAGGQEAVIVAAKAIAAACCELISDRERLRRVKEEFSMAKQALKE